MTRECPPGTWKALTMALGQLVRSLALKAREEGQSRGIKCGERVRVVGEEERRGPKPCPEGSGEVAAS